MQRAVLLMIVALLAGCAGLERQQAAEPWQHGNERFDACLQYASESYCRDDIYGHGG